MVKKYEKDLKEESPIQLKGFKEINFEGIIIKMKHLLLTTIAAVVLVGCNHIKPFDETKSVTPSRDAWRRANAGHPSPTGIPMILPSGFPRINR